MFLLYDFVVSLLKGGAQSYIVQPKFYEMSSLSNLNNNVS